jgi:hypothetical protein
MVQYPVGVVVVFEHEQYFLQSGDFGESVDRGGFAVKVDGLVQQEGVYSQLYLLAVVDLVSLETVAFVGSVLGQRYLSMMKTERAAAWMFLTADTL